MQVDMNSTFGAAIGFGAGIYWFFQGFRDLKVRRTMENVPTSKIMTGAVGSDVEIKGSIICEADKLVTAPISRSSCAFYSIEIQELRRKKNNTYWHTIDQYFSDEGFYVDDDSGATALVFVDRARITRKGSDNSYRIKSNNFPNMPETLTDSLALNKNKIRKFKLKNTSWLFSKEYKFIEWNFLAGEMVYVLGYAESGLKLPKKKKKKLSAKDFSKVKQSIKDNPKLKARFDLDNDGKLDFEELQKGAKIVADKLLQKYSREKLDDLLPKTKMVFKYQKGHHFLISNMKETELAKKIGLMSMLKMWGGPALTIACTVFLLFQWEIL